jgi:hypothetical protein
MTGSWLSCASRLSSALHFPSRSDAAKWVGMSTAFRALHPLPGQFRSAVEDIMLRSDGTDQIMPWAPFCSQKLVRNAGQTSQ